MKNLLITLILAISLTSCNVGQKKADSVDSTSTEKKMPEKPSKAVMPKFSNPEVRQMAIDYTTFANEYIAAIMAHNDAQVKEFGLKAEEWATKMAISANHMTAEDAKAWREYYGQLGEEISRALTH